MALMITHNRKEKSAVRVELENVRADAMLLNLLMTGDLDHDLNDLDLRDFGVDEHNAIGYLADSRRERGRAVVRRVVRDEYGLEIADGIHWPDDISYMFDGREALELNARMFDGPPSDT